MIRVSGADRAIGIIYGLRPGFFGTIYRTGLTGPQGRVWCGHRGDAPLTGDTEMNARQRKARLAELATILATRNAALQDARMGTCEDRFDRCVAAVQDAELEIWELSRGNTKGRCEVRAELVRANID
jgi:hypothetical protein